MQFLTSLKTNDRNGQVFNTSITSFRLTPPIFSALPVPNLKIFPWCVSNQSLFPTPPPRDPLWELNFLLRLLLGEGPYYLEWAF